MPEMALETPEEINPYIGVDIDELVKLLAAQKEKVRDANAVADECKAKQRLIEEALIDFSMLNPDTLKHSTRDVGTITFGEETVWSVNKEQWDDFYQYITDNNAFHLLQRRVNSAPLNDMTKVGLDLPPGAESFTRKKIGFRRS